MPFQYVAYQPPPPPQYEQYRSPYTGTLAQLVGSADRANAQAALISGQQQARIWQTTGEGISNALNTVVKAEHQKVSDADEAQQRELRQMQIDAAKQKIADDQTLTSVMSGANRTPITTGSFTGGNEAYYDDASGQMVPDSPSVWEPGAVQAGGTVPGRAEILRGLPAHLQSTATKMFEESDKLGRDAQTSRLALAKAESEARAAVREHMGFLGYSVAKANGDPTATQLAVNEARRSYKDDPEVSKAIDEFSQQLGDLTDPERNKQAGTLLANQSKTYMDELNKKAPTREVRVKNADGSETIKIVKDEAGTSFDSAAPLPKLGSPEYDMAAYAASIGKVPGEKLTFAETQRGERLIAINKHIASDTVEKLTPEQRGDLVDAVVANPVLFGQLTAKTKEAIIPGLMDQGFEQFAGGVSASGRAAAERWKTTELRKIADNVFLTPEERSQRVADTETSYKAQIGAPADSVTPGSAGVAGGTLKTILQTRPGEKEPPVPPPPSPPSPTLPVAAPLRPVTAPSGPTPAGLLVPGNINLANRPQAKNPDGSISTIRSIGVNIDGKEVLIPTVVNGKVVTNAEAIAEFKRTGQHLGMFDTPEHSDAFAQALHESEAAKLATPPAPPGAPTPPPAPAPRVPAPAVAVPPTRSGLPPPSPEKFQVNVMVDGQVHRMQFSSEAAAQAWAKSHNVTLSAK